MEVIGMALNTTSLKLRKTMGLTQAELNFYERVPHILLSIYEELKKINKTLAEKEKSEKKDSEE